MKRGPSTSRAVGIAAISISVLAFVAAPTGAVSAASAAVVATDVRVDVGSPPDQTPRNHVNEPAVAIDANHPNVAVAGWVDNVDRATCPEAGARDKGRCSRTGTDNMAIGGSAVAFSFDRGKSWIRPSYTGLTGFHCAPAAPCQYDVGQIHTLPWYYENGLTSFGDPGVAVGPIQVNGRFSWTNGSRVYYTGIATGLEFFAHPNSSFHGVLAAVVSRLDTPTAQSVLDKASWKPPVLIDQKVGQTAFQDKPQVWVDNVASSPYFGRVYECHGDYRSNGGGDGVPLAHLVSVSNDGGDTWNTKQLGATNQNGHGSNLWGVAGCTIRTDSHGVVYLFTQFDDDPELVPAPRRAYLVVQKSYDGGKSWTKMQVVARAGDPFTLDALVGDSTIDGYAGARTGLAAAPSVDIANGAPTGDGATDQILLTWSDNGTGLNANTTRFSWSLDGADTWSDPAGISLPGDRPLYSAAAISPNGDRAYVAYEAVTSPWRGADMTSPRPYHGVFLSAPLAADGTPGPWSVAYNGPTDTTDGHNDVRGSYPGHDLYQERVGDYVYAAATRTYALGTWIDARNATVCDPIQRWRAASQAAGQRVLPAPWPLTDCPGTFGNTDVYAATTG